MSQAKSWLKGCAIGCGALMVLGIGSCVGFMVWVNQPGELVEPELLVGRDTVGFAEWRLDLDDPGTEQLVVDVLDAMGRSRERVQTPLPEAVDGFLKGWQRRRDERNFRQLFPMVAAWSMHRNEMTGKDLHQLTVSVERFGNRAVLIDWILALTLGRSPDVEVVPYEGEKIYEIDNGAAFFLRSSDVVIASDLELARLAVDRLRSVEPSEPSELAPLLASLPVQRPLKCAITNSGGALERVLQNLADANKVDKLAAVNWNRVGSVTLSGEFVDGSAFAATLTVTRSSGVWEQQELEELGAALQQSVNLPRQHADYSLSTNAGTATVEMRFSDLPAQLESLIEQDFAPPIGPEPPIVAVEDPE